jgi:hypothetical protein
MEGPLAPRQDHTVLLLLPIFTKVSVLEDVVWFHDQEPCVHGIALLAHGHCWSWVYIA